MHQLLNRGPGIRLAARRVRPAAENPARSSVRWLLVRSSEQQGEPFARSPVVAFVHFLFRLWIKSNISAEIPSPYRLPLLPPFWGWRGPMIIDLDSWEMGYADGLNGHPSRPQADLDPFSYSSGYVQGRTQDSHHPQSSRRQATQSRGADSRLLISFL